MRRRLLDATINCLVEYGYSGTTTTKVAEIAGVTRGAQIHHYPTKNDLVTAAIRHLASKRAELAIERAGEIQDAADPLDAALELMWELHQGPMFHATVELWVAARVDPELRKHLALVEPTTTASIIELAKSIFGDYARQPNFRHCLYTTLDAVRGILLNSAAFDTAHHELNARWQRAKNQLRAMVEAQCGTPT